MRSTVEFLIERNKLMYCIPERENTKTVIDKSLIGTLHKVSRIILRLGYPFEYTDFKYSTEEKEEIKSIVRKALNINEEWRLNEFLERFGVSNTTRKIAQNHLLEKAYKESGQKKRRSIWYKDTKDSHNLPFLYAYIAGVKRCWTGDYSAATKGFDDYEPAALSGAVWHNLYVIYAGNDYRWNDDKKNEITDYFRKHGDYYGHIFYAHPLDIINFDTKA